MKKTFLVAVCWIVVICLNAQTVKEKLQTAYRQFESDSQLRHSMSSLYVINAKTGEVVFDKNSQIGLAPASTQKIITAATAFELLGKGYRYKTEFWLMKYIPYSRGEIITIKPSGDPTFGSWRYTTSNPQYIYQRLSKIFKDSIWSPDFFFYHIYKNEFDVQKIPDGWIWQDIGNYYGAGAGAFNWKENQFDIELSASDKIGDPVKIRTVDTSIGILGINNQLRTGPKNSGDNAYYYFLYGNQTFFRPILKGTIPAGEKMFKISAAAADPYTFFINDLIINKLAAEKYSDAANFFESEVTSPESKDNRLLYTHYSPSLDSIIYWFLQKSINLYGEALLKTFAYEKKGFGATDSGIVIVKDFWKQKGLDPEELNIKDGSGLSPQNRVTTHAQVEILKYAKQQSWFPYFFNALPEFNNMKMKSGSISDVKGFCGYHTSGDGSEYIFSFLINNYSGASSAVVSKMYKVLDVLK